MSGVSVQGVSVSEGLCPGESLSRGSLLEDPQNQKKTGGTHPLRMLSCLWMQSSFRK